MVRARPLLLLYVAMLVASRLFIVLAPQDGEALLELPEGTRIVALRAFADGERGDRRVRLAFRESGPPVEEAVVLLHGSPGSLQDFDRLAQRLGSDRRVLIPDLLGFGRSERDVPDHSFVAQADALEQLFAMRGIRRAHLVAFSWGGGVALELARRWPERVASLAMVSAIGVQELELLGRYELNRLVHAFQHALVVVLDWGLPHFGHLTQGPLGRGFTRSFLDSDQRPLRGGLEEYAGPMIVLHGREDFLVPPAAAREHHRLVPQSELVWLDGGHLVLWQHPDRVAEVLVEWLARVERGSALRRVDASPERRALAARRFERSLAGPQNGLGWAVFFLLVFVASMVSEDLTCAGVGLLVATGQIGFSGGVAACVVALVLGDLVLYAGGRAVGPPMLRRLGRDPGEVGPIGERLRRSGGWVVLFGRFVPGARLPTYVVAGVLRYPVLRFVLWLVVAALLWAPLLVGLTALGGAALEMDREDPRVPWSAAIALVLAIALAARLLPRLATHRGRKRVQARWRRLLRWEFWPIWAIYLPLLPSLLRFAAEFRSVRLPTLVNPPIPGGGLAGESKAAIDTALIHAPAHRIETAVVEPGAIDERLAAVRRFLASESLDYPIVLKPDIGERGRGVLIAEDEGAVRAHLEANPARALVQPFVRGEEFGLFYMRRPHAERGELFSIARKAPRVVTGDGARSLEALILDDPICLPMAEKLLLINRDHLADVPESGEVVRVTRLGTHSLGCRFLVGEDLRSAALEWAVDRLSQRAELDFGRYDVLAEDEAALSRGEFRVVEFNGLTGEAAHIYDPRYGLFAGLAILRAQWRRAFEIGAGHRAAGRRPLSWRALASLVRAARA